MVLLTALAVVLAIVGFRASALSMPLTDPRFSLHLCVVTGLTLGTSATAVVSTDVTAVVAGIWLSGLVLVYSGHAFAVREWGSTLTRDVLLFGLRRVHHFGRSKPILLLTLLSAVAVSFTGGCVLTRATIPEVVGATWIAAYSAAAIVFLAIAAGISRAARMPVEADLLLGLALGGCGSLQAGPPAEDPSLGTRWPVRLTRTPWRRPTVAFFVIDSLRAANLSAYGYERPTTPFIGSLVNECGARAVPLAVSNCASSDVAAWALLSSRRARHLAANAPCLHDLLRATGSRVRFFLSGSHRYWQALGYLYGSDHDQFVDLMVDDELVAEVHKLPRCGGGGDFLFFHLMSVHMASGAEPPMTWKPARNRMAITATDPMTWKPARNRMAMTATDTLDVATREQIQNHYDNAVLQADTDVARIIELLREKEYLDDALVIITADHGEALGERTPPAVGHGCHLYQESVHIPLIVWDTTRSLPPPACLADQTDVGPTILERIGLDPPSAWQGTSIFSPTGRRSVHVEHIAHRVGSAQTHMEAILVLLPSGMFKLMRYHQAGREVFRRLYCLSTDPAELHDLNGAVSSAIEAEIEQVLEQYHRLSFRGN